MQFLNVRVPSGRQIVLTFDICSSSDILEDLTRNHAVHRYLKLIAALKHTLAKEQLEIRAKCNASLMMYKFTGDGWIILMQAPDQNQQKLGRALLKLMRSLSRTFRREFEKLSKHLEAIPQVTGINFGIAAGNIEHAKIFQKDEYLGRAINVACRLQGAIKDKDKRPAYKALATKTVFNEYLAPASSYEPSQVTRVLRNINANRPISCVKLRLL